MPSTQKLPSGNYRGLYRDSEGKQQYTPTRSRKSDAYDDAVDAQAKAKRRAAANKGTLSAKTTWGEWWSLISEERTFDSDSGSVEDRNVRLHIRPRWEDVPLNKIRRRDVQQWVEELKRGKAPSYVQRIYSTFSTSITLALEREVLDASPIAGVTLPKRIRKPRAYMSAGELEALVEHLPAAIADALVFMLETGIRPTELSALHAHRLDLDRGLVTVAESYIFRRKIIRGWPKNGDARTIVLSPTAIEVARRALDGRDLRTGCGVPHLGNERCTHPLVFLAPTGVVLNRDLLGEHLRRAAGKAERDPLSPYSVRRGFASEVAAAGLDVFALQRVMGHATVTQTQTYVQETGSAREQMLAALAARPSTVHNGPDREAETSQREADRGKTRRDATSSDVKT